MDKKFWIRTEDRDDNAPLNNMDRAKHYSDRDDAVDELVTGGGYVFDKEGDPVAFVAPRPTRGRQ